MMLKVIACYADGWNLGQSLPTEEYRRRAESLSSTCEAIGRDPSDIARSIAVMMVCAETDSQAEVLAERLQAGLTTQLVRGEQVIVGGAETCARWVLDNVRLGVTDVIIRLPTRPIGPQLAENFFTLVAPRIREAAGA